MTLRSLGLQGLYSNMRVEPASWSPTSPRSRRVHLAGCTENPSGVWVAQRARNLAWSLAQRPSPLRFLIHDRDSKLTDAFDEVFKTEGISIIRTPVRASKANAFAERFVGTVRRECLDWVLIVGRRQLERTLRTYVEHYKGHRPHRGLGLVPPQPVLPLRLAASEQPGRVRRRDRLGGLIHEYSVAASRRSSLRTPQHHVDLAGGDELANLVTLCRVCHRR